LKLQQFNIAGTIEQLKQAATVEARIGIITGLLYEIFEAKRALLDYKIQQAIRLIIHHQGNLSIQELNKALNITERTFERRFLTQVGVSPKQFSQIIKFQLSLNQLMDKDYIKLTDIVYNNGFADQSHFIRVFKAFTGKTPKQFTATAR
jgi:AraC-like DNA-binding protein